jgi:hypothetical protein
VIGESDAVEVVSEMNEGGVIFGDGIEADCLDFAWGQTARIRMSNRSLHLVRR